MSRSAVASRQARVAVAVLGAIVWLATACGSSTPSGSGTINVVAAEKVSKATGYKVLSHHLVFSGLCPECAVAR